MRATLLAVDAGLRTGLALYGNDGRLIWYRSQHLGSPAALKRKVYSLLNELDHLEWIVVEGGGPLASIWEKEALRRGVSFKITSAETWRDLLFYKRQQRSGKEAKHYADDAARKVIEWSNVAKPTSLRHDAAEAILVGLWGVLQVGWLPHLPGELSP